MKIREISEGFWTQNWAGLKGMKKGGPGFTAAKLMKAGEEEAEKQMSQGNTEASKKIDEIYKIWLKHYGATKDVNISKWASNFFNSDVSRVTVPSVINPQTAKTYIDMVYRAYASKQLQPMGSGPVEPYKSPLGVKIVSDTDPITVSYKGTNFMLNNVGQWTKNGMDTDSPREIASPALTAEIEKVVKHLFFDV